MSSKIKKSIRTKHRLIDAVFRLISDGDKVISVNSITKESKLAYGTFYRYFKDLDDIHFQVIERSLIKAQINLEKELALIEPIPLRVYISWFIAIDMFKQENIASWLLDHPGKINQVFMQTEPMSEKWIREAVKEEGCPNFRQKNADHYLKSRHYIFWMYPHCLSELVKGKKTKTVFTELMNASNIFNFSKEIHSSYIKDTIKYIENNKLSISM